MGDATGAKALADTWSSGGAVDWDARYAGEQRRRVALPLYPFERSRRWIDAPAAGTVAESRAAQAPSTYRSTWTRAPKRATPAKRLAARPAAPGM